MKPISRTAAKALKSIHPKGTTVIQLAWRIRKSRRIAQNLMSVLRKAELVDGNILSTRTKEKIYTLTGKPYTVSTHKTPEPRKPIIMAHRTTFEVMSKLPPVSGHIPQPARFTNWHTA